MIRVLVVDDHPIVRQGLVSVLEDATDFEVVGSVGSAEEAIALVGRLRPDVVVLDLELSGLGGVAAIPRFIDSSPHSRMLVFTAYDTEEYVFGAIRAGASGYLLKGASADEIARGIRAVHDGGSYLEPRVAAKVLAAVNASHRGEHTLLSGRELEVLRLVAAGRSNKEIGRTLSISERTARFHVTSILNKLGASTRAEAVALGTQRGLL